MMVTQNLLFAQADTTQSHQFFIQIEPENQLVKCGRYLELDTMQITKIFFTKTDSSLFWTMDEALDLLFARQHGKPLYFIHGFYGASPPLTQRTVLAFKKLYLKDSTNETTDIIHLVWDSNKLNYKQSKEAIAKSRTNLSDILRKAAQRSANQKVDLLCHSMGNQFLMETIKGGFLTENVIHKLILAAADFDMTDFVVYQQGLSFVADKILVLYNKKDKILAVARLRNAERRLGQRLPKTKILPSFTFINCSKMKINHSLIAKLNRHTYFLASDEVRRQIHSFLHTPKDKV